MFDVQNARINTAGAYVRINGLYVFTIGIKPHNGHIPVVRLGGHREEHETGWQCAAREVFEEANVQIKSLSPQATFLTDGDNLEAKLSNIQWQHETEQEPVPILVVTYLRDEKMTLSLMYLAHAEGIPLPSSEVKGLLLLDELEIHQLCQEPMTLKVFLNNGGKAILKDEFDTSRVLEPFAQLRLLSRILIEYVRKDKSRLTQRALDAGESPRFQAFSLPLLFHSDGVPPPAPAQVTQTVRRQFVRRPNNRLSHRKEYKHE